MIKKMNLLCFEFNKINKINDKPNYSSKERRIKIECVYFDQNMTGLYNLDIVPMVKIFIKNIGNRTDR